MDSWKDNDNDMMRTTTMDTDSDSDADFSMFRAMKSAMWDPMATMFAVSIENEWLRPSMSGPWGRL